MRNRISISDLKYKFLKSLFLFTLVAGGGGALLLYYLLPAFSLGGFAFIILYFFSFGVFSIFMIDTCMIQAHKQVLLVQMALKIFKIILSIAVMLIYCVAVRDNIKGFLIVFIAYYLLYLIHETCFFFFYILKQKRTNKTNNETLA